MTVSPRCGEIGSHAWLHVEWAAVAMIVAALFTMVKIRILIVEAKHVLVQKLHSYLGLVQNSTGFVTLVQITISNLFFLRFQSVENIKYVYYRIQHTSFFSTSLNFGAECQKTCKKLNQCCILFLCRTYINYYQSQEMRFLTF